MENFVNVKLEFNDKTLSTLVANLNSTYLNCQSNFVDICIGVYKIWDYCKGNYWKAKDNEYYNSYKLLEKFGFDKKAVSRYKQCYEKYIDGKNDNNYCLWSLVNNYSPSKLFELLVLSNEDIIELIEQDLLYPTMTVKQIRELIKSFKNGFEEFNNETTININEEDIPLAYDPKQEYEYSYFENKTKNQLLNIVWELQKAYQKLKSKGEKKNVK